MAKHECKYFLRSRAGQLVCSVCGKPANDEPLIAEKRELYVSDQDKAKAKEEADAKAKAEGKSGEVPSGH